MSGKAIRETLGFLGVMARTVRAIYRKSLNKWGLPVPPPL